MRHVGAEAAPGVIFRAWMESRLVKGSRYWVTFEDYAQGGKEKPMGS